MRKIKKVVLGATVMSMMMSMAAPVAMPATSFGTAIILAADKEQEQGRCGDNVFYQVDTDGTTLRISGTGAMWDNFPINLTTQGINKIVIEKGVTVIGSNIFSKVSEVKTVEIADTVTTIKADGLSMGITETLEIPATVTKVETDAITNSNKIVIKGDVSGYEVGSIRGANQITLDGAASDLGKAIYSTYIGIGITISKENTKCRIANGCLVSADGKELYYCVNPGKVVEIPDTVEKISTAAFANLYLDTVKFGKNVKSVGDFAFAGSNIAKLKLNKKLSTIGVKAFSRTNIKKVSFAGKVKMDVAAFNNKTKISNSKKFKYAQTTLDTARIAKKKLNIKFAKVSGAKGYDIQVIKGKKVYKYTTKKNSFSTKAPKKLYKGYDEEKTYAMENDEYLKKIDGAITVKVRPYQVVKKSKKSKKTKKVYGMWSKEMVVSAQ
ncbi:MAG: leucine-rich repeat domain-containing protein [Eubacterium sp.]|nr:leucine-rich repeat domain-containing protein [Eubacterium sp.]